MSLSVLNIPFTKQMRADLAGLANGIAPLQRWIAEKKYNPEMDPTFSSQPMPWRAPGMVLTPADTGVIDFFEGLLRETSNDVSSMNAWKRIAENPLARCPIAAVTSWRSDRGLDEYPAFGIVKSQNVLLDVANQQIARSDFYRDTLPDLAYCLALSRPTTLDGWEKLALELFSNTLYAWPDTVYPAKVFLSQFAADMLYAMLGLRNSSGVPGQAAYATAVLTELGQARRRGNKNTPADASRAVKRFIAQIQEDLHVKEAQ